MIKVVPKKFFERNAVSVARDLVGKYLVGKVGGEEIALMVTEVEAYGGMDDLASHARFGKTKRSSVMFGEPGVFYVYLIYGMHFMLNVICGKNGEPCAVLIRGVNGLNGPGKVAKQFGVNKSLNAKEASKKSGLWFEDRGFVVSENTVKVSKRIGVDYAGKWANKLWRFGFEAKKR